MRFAGGVSECLLPSEALFLLSGTTGLLFHFLEEEDR